MNLPTEARAKHSLSTGKPLALLVFLENVGHLHGIKLPQWAMNTIDFVTEEYAKLVLRLYGAHRCYDRVWVLEDARATGPNLAASLLELSRTHTVDVLLLVHGQERCLIGHRNLSRVGDETFGPLRARYAADPSLLDLRVVYGVNCFGLSLAETWLALGAQAVNGAVGVNWLPEPSITVFLRDWLGGKPFSTAVEHSYRVASRAWRHVWRPSGGRDHDFIATSRQTVVGMRDVTIEA